MKNYQKQKKWTTKFEVEFFETSTILFLAGFSLDSQGAQLHLPNNIRSYMRLCSSFKIKINYDQFQTLELYNNFMFKWVKVMYSRSFVITLMEGLYPEHCSYCRCHCCAIDEWVEWWEFEFIQLNRIFWITKSIRDTS